MIQIKSLFDAADASDGLRLWVGAVALTRDLTEWCRVDRWLKEGAPPVELARWFEEHPGGWEYFRAKHHEALDQGGSLDALRRLSRKGIDENITLLHAESNPSQNTAVSLYEYLVELQAYCSDDQSGQP
jgi:uncharacterized protein YeaO (DUF488 family)